MKSRIAAAALAMLLPALPAAGQSIEMARASDASALADPSSSFWKDRPSVALMMLPQTVTTPSHPDAAVRELRVKAAHDGASFAFWIEWDDPTQSERIVTDEFGDQIAVELPMRFRSDAIPSPMMGNPGGRVSILQWRAAFQHDIEAGPPTVKDLYPNALVDVYPDEVLAATDAAPYRGALSVDNPISRAGKTPVLDQMAEGWGTMTVKAEQHADGHGVWSDGKWRVVVSHPMNLGGDNDPEVLAGGKTVVAFAVWEGGNAEVGARKSWGNWAAVTVAE